MFKYFTVLTLSVIFFSKAGIHVWSIAVYAAVFLFYLMNVMQDYSLSRNELFIFLAWTVLSVAGYYFLGVWHTHIPHAYGALTWPVVIIFLSVPVQALVWSSVVG